MDDTIIVFDVCDVLLKTSFQNVFNTLFPDRADIPKLEKDLAYYQFSRGKICAYDYYEHFIAKYNLEINYNEFCAAWNTFFIGEMDDIESLLGSLSKRYQLYVLSNSNVLHSIFSRTNYPQIFRHFSRIYYSFELGLRKPEAAIFLTMISLLSRTVDIIFIDDKPENIQSALSLGIRALRFTHVNALKIELNKYLEI
jgi:glucose-1-phosphatase